MKLMLATLCLNEMEWLPYLWRQHHGWPGLCAWVFVEAADAVYAQANPEMVKDGLSVDGTTEFLGALPAITHIKHGLSSGIDLAQGKCAARQRYLDLAEVVKPDWILILDADEFYAADDQRKMIESMQAAPATTTAICFRYRHLWRPPCWEEQKLLGREVVGGFWGIPHCHGWRWRPGLRYDNNHMTPTAPGGGEMTKAYDVQCVHTAFASAKGGRAAKHRYYAERGEAVDRRRAWYVESRAAWETWTPTTSLPRGARVIAYAGPVPECFKGTP